MIKKYMYKDTFISVKNINVNNSDIIKKPHWLKIKLPTNLEKIRNIKDIIRKRKLHSVCEESDCPNLFECFSKSIATFMILGSVCTRNCSFCKITHGKPSIPDKNEPKNLAKTIIDMKLKHVVITSVNRDDLKDGGANHFIKCIDEIRKRDPSIFIEILVPDFRGKMKSALTIINSSPPDLFNHNLETVPRLYNVIRPHSNYRKSLKLLLHFKESNPNLLTKSGIMLGLGENNEEVFEVMQDLRYHKVDMLTLGQYLQPSKKHIQVKRYVDPEEFIFMREKAISMGFNYAFCGPFVRSSYHASDQIHIINKK